MNLKDAFRFQNKLNALMEEAEAILGEDANITTVENTHFRKKVMPEAEDETIQDTPLSEYSDRINEVAGLLLWLLEERCRLSAAIRKAKEVLPIDMDSEVGLNGKRQEIARLFSHMKDIRASETVIPNGGFGYRFNSDGIQTTYKCDVKRVTTIHFDRNAIRRYEKELTTRADETSAAVDRCLINSDVSYEAPFDVNESFSEVLDLFTEKSL